MRVIVAHSKAKLVHGAFAVGDQPRRLAHTRRHTHNTIQHDAHARQVLAHELSGRSCQHVLQVLRVAHLRLSTNQ